MFDNQQFRDVVINPTLNALQVYSRELEELMVGTLAQESGGGTYLKELNNGPGLGPFQMNPKTHDDIWTVILPHNTILTHNLMKHCMILQRPKPELMIYHLSYACAMSAIEFWRFKLQLPKTIEGLAEVWKKYYNTSLGQGTQEQFVANYLKFTGSKHEQGAEKEGREGSQTRTQKREKESTS